jgi:putative membrane protein insertion efficiency factor
MALGQDDSDLELLKSINLTKPEFNNRKVEYYAKSVKGINKFNPLVHVFGGLLFVYQKFVSVQISSKCSFEPSCSSFSKQALKEFGLIKGLALTTDRLMRCNVIAAKDISAFDLDFKNEKVRDEISKYYYHKH